MTIRERVERLRKELGQDALAGFLVPRSDEHQGEYVPPHAQRLSWLTGFTGSAGLAIVLAARSPDTLRGLHAWLKTHLAAHQMPVRWYVLETLPRTSRGKINRDRIAEACLHVTPVDFRSILAEGS